MNNTITALITTYKRPKFLKRAIRTALNQTYKNLKVSVFDDASGDETQSLVNELKKTDSRIHYHCPDANMGALQNFKSAFQSVDTPYFSLFSDDDALASDFYENAIRILESHPDIMFVVFNILSIDGNGNLLGGRVDTHTLKFYRGDERFNIASADAVSSTWTAMVFRKEVAKIYCDMHDKFDVGSDMRFLLLARAKYNFAHFSKVGAFFTCHANSISGQRPHFDLVHHAVQISRHIEVYFDPIICQLAKNQAYSEIKNMLSPNMKDNFHAFLGAMKQAIKNICDREDLDEKAISNIIQNAKHADYKMTAFFLNLTYNNKIINYIIHIFFSRYYTRHKMHHKTAMSALQNGPYKEIFEQLKILST